MDTKAFIDCLIWFQPLFLWYFAAITMIYSVLIILGSLKVFARHSQLKEEDISQVLNSESLPEITFLIPMFNESATIIQNVQNTLHLNYRYKKILIVNDGSTDNCVELLINEFELIPVPKLYDEKLKTAPIKQVYRSQKFPEIVLIDKEHGGKFDVVNAGLNVCSSNYFLIFDADTFIDDKGFEALIRPILEDPKIIAVGASVRIDNGCTFEYNKISTTKFPKTYLTSIQGIEYLRAFLSRSGWDFCNGNFIVSGAFSIFSRDLIIEIGGFSDCVGEDVEIIVRLHRIMLERRKKYKIFYLPDPVAWTVCPEEWKVLAKQRRRWHQGLLESLWYHKRMFLNPRYGFKGLFIFPYWVFCEAIEPFIEILGYIYIIVSWWLGALYWPFLVYYLLLSYGLVFLITLYSLFTEEMSFKKYPSIRTLFLLFTSCIVENIGYHQLSLYWRVRGFFSFIYNFRKIHRESKRLKKKIKEGNKKASEDPLKRSI